jgi:hypothetical protein
VAEERGPLKIVRYLAVAMVVVSGAKVLPGAAASLVEQSLGLMDAREPFLVRSGISRLKLLLRAQAAREKALACGAMGRLVELVERHGDDAGEFSVLIGAACLEDCAALAFAIIEASFIR